jgi:RND family efflux transporter MFP subunit
MKVFASGPLLTVSFVLLAGCHSDQSSRAAVPQNVQARIVESRQQEEPLTLRATGTLHARESVIVSAQVMGRIERVFVHEGDMVRAGQVLIELDAAALRASADQATAAAKATEKELAAAQSDAGLAKSTLERYKQLQVQKSVSPQELDEVERRAEASNARADAVRAQGDAARAQISGASAMLSYARLRAPFSGVVTARLADPGTMAAPGVPLLQLESDGPLQLQATIDESNIAAVRKGMKISLTINGAQTSEITGTVAEVIPAADPASHSFLVKIDVPHSKELRSGMYGTAEIATGKHQVIAVPRSAVVLRGSLPCAYVLDSNGIAQLRYLTLGNAQGNVVEVLSGISPAEKLVNDPADRDLAGKHIEAQP